MRKPIGITAAFFAVMSVLAVALFIIWGMWLPSAKQIDNQRDELTQQTARHVTGSVVPTGQPAQSVEDSNGRTYHHLVVVNHPDYFGKTLQTPVIVSVDSLYPPTSVGLNVSENGHIVHADELPESHRHWWPMYTGLAVFIAGLIVLVILGVFMVRAWRGYNDEVDRERRRQALQQEEEKRELAKRAALTGDQLSLQSAITRIKNLDDADPEKADLLELAQRLYQSASDSKGLRLELEVFAKLMGHPGVKSHD